MDYTRLEYIKNVNDDGDVWAYEGEGYLIGAYFRLNFKNNEAKGVDNHAFNLPKGSLIILSQRLPGNERSLTHVVELVNEGSEDKPQWKTGTWGIFRWVKVHWIADFTNLSSIPLDKKEMRAEWGYFDTKAKLLSSPKLMSQWGNIDKLRAHLGEVFN